VVKHGAGFRAALVISDGRYVRDVDHGLFNSRPTGFLLLVPFGLVRMKLVKEYSSCSLVKYIARCYLRARTQSNTCSLCRMSDICCLMAPEFMSDWTAIKVQSIDVSGPRG